MKIGIITFACDAGKSGIGQYLIHLLREFAKTDSDWEFEIIGFEDELDIFLPPKHKYSTHTISTRWKNPILNILWQNTLFPLLCRTHNYDAVFLPAANRRLPLWLPCPSVGTVHDFSSMHIEGKYDPLRDVYIKRLLPFLIRRLGHVISVSECTKHDIIQYARYPNEKITVIPHGVDHSTYYPRDKEESYSKISTKYQIRPPYILYISRIEHPGKNHIRLIHAFAQLKKDTDLPHQLVLAGSDWNRAEEVHKAADATGLDKDICFTGFVDSADIPDLYCGSDLFVFPSLFEGFGMPILEAMASGTPIACANISSLPEVAGDAAVYFSPENNLEITETMKDLLSDISLHEEYIKSGLLHAANFNWPSVSENTLKVIRNTA